MKTLTRTLGLLFAAWLPSAAQSETLRCSGGMVDEGDSRISVLYKCGQPLLKDSFCAPLFQGGNPNPVPEPFASSIVPCQLTDEWIYDRGPGNLPALVRMRSGVVLTIRHRRDPQ